MKFDEKTAAIFSEGRTKGIFQLDKQGNWSKKVQPTSIEELSDLISIIRPGCTRAMLDGKSMTQHYVDRKAKIDKVKYLDDSLEEVFQDTYGVLVYQEQAMKCSATQAGFNLEQADDLRKAIGKKKADLMEKIREKFVNGCIITGIVEKEVAEQIFDWIEKSARYSFNKSHGISYAVNGWEDAYIKAHYPAVFFCDALEFAKEKQDPHQEVSELVSDAKYFDIGVKLPTIARFTPNFELLDENTITFGLNSIKSLTGVNGEKLINVIAKMEEDFQKFAEDFTWIEILLFLSPQINKRVFVTLCSIGFFTTKKTEVTRSKALYDYNIFKSMLTKKEVEWLQENYSRKKWSNMITMFKDLMPLKKNGGGVSNVNRSEIIKNEIYLLENPPYDIEDTPMWLATEEIKYVGCPISISKIDTVDDTAEANTTCKELLDGKKGQNICLAANLTRIANHKIKKEGKNKGKLMSFLTAEDSTGVVDNIVVFPETRDKYAHLLYDDANVILFGKMDDSFVIEKIYEL